MGEYDPFKADIWSVGVILFCMLFGFIPFHEEEEDAIFELIKQGFTAEVKGGYGPWFPSDIAISKEAMDLLSGMLTFAISDKIFVSGITNKKI